MERVTEYFRTIGFTQKDGPEPFDYLCHTLKKRPYAETVEKLERLLPWAMKRPSPDNYPRNAQTNRENEKSCVSSVNIAQ